jgi:hypothetical protein
MTSFNQIVKDIKDVKIQGATEIAKAGLKAVPKKSPTTKMLAIIISVFFLIIFSLLFICSSP